MFDCFSCFKPFFSNSLEEEEISRPNTKRPLLSNPSVESLEFSFQAKRLANAASKG
jgi:hypothetical protein